MRIARVQAAAGRLGQRRYGIPQRIFHVRAIPVIDAEHALHRGEGRPGGFEVELLVADALAVAAVRQVTGRQVVFEFAQQTIGVEWEFFVRFVAPDGRGGHQRAADSMAQPIAGVGRQTIVLHVLAVSPGNTVFPKRPPHQGALVRRQTVI
jgi:hypothetical protein